MVALTVWCGEISVWWESGVKRSVSKQKSFLSVNFDGQTPVSKYYTFLAVQWPRWLFACLSPRRPELELGSVHVEFVMDTVALGQVFLRHIWFCPVNIVPRWFSIHISSGG
jgi:hypothetical protein